MINIFLDAGNTGSLAVTIIAGFAASLRRARITVRYAEHQNICRRLQRPMPVDVGDSMISLFFRRLNI